MGVREIDKERETENEDRRDGERESTISQL